MFAWNGMKWEPQAFLKASNEGSGDVFGTSVSISGETIVVGAWAEASRATGVNGDQNDNGATFAGAAYVFVRNGMSWHQQAYLKASNTESSDSFGGSVSVSGDLIVVGAVGEDSTAGVFGSQGDNNTQDSGAAYVFVRSGTKWSQEAFLKASNAEIQDFFGGSVSISGDSLVVGARREDSSATGVNGDQDNNGAFVSGAAYVFVRNGTNWIQQAYLKASNTEFGDLFGVTVSISGEMIVVGASLEDSGATGVNGNQNDNSIPSSGAAYVFERSATLWRQRAYLKASNPDISDEFGLAVAVTGDTVVVGTQLESSMATGVNGNQANNDAIRAGAVYPFLITPDNTGTAYCFGDGTGASCPCFALGVSGEGCPNSGGLGGATLAGYGHASISDDTFQLQVSGVPGVKPGLILRGANQILGGAGLPLGDGLLCTNGQLARSQVQVTNAGTTFFTDFQGSPFGLFSFGPGVPTNYQFWYRDPQNTCSGAGFNFSNAWTVTWQL